MRFPKKLALLSLAMTPLLGTFLASAQTPSPPAAEIPLPAFPGAEGFGANTPGGRGGEVYEVTSLEDAGFGTLRDAVSKPNRTIVFRISGNIDLKSTLTVNQPNITIAGQTAPGDGICLRYFTFGIATHDVVVRFLRCRLGDSGPEADALDILHNSSNVIVDHCSATWSVDECLSTSGIDQNVTIQWCLIGESLRKSIHAKGPHGYGSLARANGPISWYHNLWIHNDGRNPRLGDNYGRGTSPFFDVRNNVMYDYGDTASGLTQGKWQANYVANLIRPGPSSKAKTPIHMGPDSDITFFLAGNVFEDHPDFTADNSKFIDNYELQNKPVAKTAKEPFPSPVYRNMSAEQGYQAVLASVGAVLPKRDPVDTRLIDHVKNKAGKLIDSQKEVGGWPELKSTPAPLDTDHDGIPDDWEKSHNLNPTNPADAQADPDNDGYTNLEEYLNNTDPAQFINYHNPANNTATLKTP